MSDIRDELLRTLDRIVEDTVTTAVREAADEHASGTPSAGPGGATRGAPATTPLWSALEAAGFTAIDAGGDDGIPFADAMALVRQTGFHALPVPLAETIIARRILARAGITVPSGAITVAPPGAGPLPAEADGRLQGTARSVPWGRSAPHAIIATAGGVHLLDTRDALLSHGASMAGEPRDHLDLARARPIAQAGIPDAPAMIEAEGALVRSLQLSGALTAVLDHALTWVNDRVQFGRPIAKHQAIQHHLAVVAEEAAAAGAAADLAVEACATLPDHLAVAIAKSRSGEAAGKAANIVHAVFGAMGFTREHALHYTTRRLWSWRNEFGSEVQWQTFIGRTVAAKGGRGLWPLLTGEG
jgi:acyl-CoA dehydrogenase